jgi:hypothetical protein
MFYADNFCRYTENETQYIYRGPCHSCARIIEIRIPKDALYQYRQGKFIQDAMPMLSPSAREFLMTGYCDPCFMKATSPEEEGVEADPE